MNDIFRYKLYHDGIVQDYKNILMVIIRDIFNNIKKKSELQYLLEIIRGKGYRWNVY